LLRFVDELGQSFQAQNDTIAFTAVKECRAALEKLVTKMDGIEAGFDKIAEKSCESVPCTNVRVLNRVLVLSSSRLSASRRRGKSLTKANNTILIAMLQ
jgi:autophagy-related protein 11